MNQVTGKNLLVKSVTHVKPHGYTQTIININGGNVNEKIYGLLCIETETGIETRFDTTINLIKQMDSFEDKHWAILVNLTGHEINYIHDQESILIPISGVTLRCTPEEKVVSYIGGIKLISRQFSFANTPPCIIEGIWYIVPFKNLLISSRNDFVVPQPTKRKDGKIIGCSQFFNLTNGESLQSKEN